MTITDLKNMLLGITKSMKMETISAEQAVNQIHRLSPEAMNNFGMSLDNDLYRNGIFCKQQALKINPNLDSNNNWFEIYRPWGSDHDSVRPVDKTAVDFALNAMLTSIRTGDVKEAEQLYDMEDYGNKYANLADC